ncbi:hypothetical protein [Carnobacterium sp.]|uniref:hypothetical protein n=1 Tax=Carnobacterium sp. TaxID=48221 RepID=UPI0028A65625|nr:hypothetical protein [Carnobacterium sp.]
MKKTYGTILLIISNVLSSGIAVFISFGIFSLSSIEIEGKPPSYTGAIQIALVILVVELVKWFSFYQVVYKNKTPYLVVYLLISMLLMTAGFKQLMALLLGVFYFVSIVLLFFSIKDVQAKKEPTLTEKSEKEHPMKSGLEKLGFFLLILATVYNGAELLYSVSSMDPYFREQPVALMQIIIIPVIILTLSCYALYKIGTNRYSYWKYLFVILAGLNGVSILNMWYIKKQAGASFAPILSDPLAILTVKQLLVSAVYLIGFVLMNKKAGRE